LGAAEEELEVEFFFEEVGGTFGVAKIFGDIAPCLDLKGYTATLERSTQAENALTVGMVKTFGNTNERSETPRDAFVVVVQAGIGGVMAIRL
jgi:hypothetical protein